MFTPAGVLAVVRAAGSDQDAVIYLVATFARLRRGELLALRWRDVDFAGSVIRVRASYAAGQLTTPKSGKIRSVPMATDVAEAPARLGQRPNWIGGDDLVFPGWAGSARRLLLGSCRGSFVRDRSRALEPRSGERGRGGGGGSGSA